MKLRLLPEAIERIEVARAWWLDHRDKAPLVFDEELADALEQIATSPELGQRSLLSKGRDVRRRLMKKTAFHVYYEVVDEAVHVLTLWGAVRGSEPRFH